jgi:CRISPR-associated protein Cmr3
MNTSASTEWVGLRLEPLDTLFFRDGRPFDAATRVAGGLPNPQALAGALRTVLLAREGFRFDKFARERKRADVEQALRACDAPPWVTEAHFRGPWLGLDRGNTVEPLLPSPAVLAPAKESGWSRAWPLDSDLPGWNDLDGLLPLWRRREPDPKADGGFLTLEGLKQFLNVIDPPETARHEPDKLYGFDNRIGIGINKHTLTSEEGELYGIRLLSLRPKVMRDGQMLPAVCLYAEMQPGPEAPARPWFSDTPVPFGGEGKYVRVEEVPARDWPKPNLKRARSLWYLATPTFLQPSEQSHRPLPKGVKAAASGPGVAISGWDVARNGPKATRFAVPAGAVYFFEEAGSETRFVSDNGGRSADDWLREGWGFALQGAWKEEQR